MAEGKINPLLMHQFRLRNTFFRYGINWNDHYIVLYRKKLSELCIPFTGVEKLLSGIRQKAKTGLITNAYDGEEQRDRVRNSGLESYFDIIVVAGDIGIYKPDPSIFLYALNRIRISPGQALYVGDSVSNDIAGAKSAGMKTVLFKRHSNQDTHIADYCVLGIDGLQMLFAKMGI